MVDTRSVEWQRGGGPMAALSKTLSVDGDGDEIVGMRWLAQYAGPLTGVDGGFRLATEYYFLLGEEFTHWDLDPEHGDTLLRFRRGFWMDRRAGNLTTGTAEMPVGSRALGWMIADEDPFVGVFEAAGASLEGTWAPDPAALVLDRPLVTIVDSRDAAWQPHPLLENSWLKVLSCTLAGDIAVSLWHIPPGATPTMAALASASPDSREFAFVLEGSLLGRIAATSGGDSVARTVELSEGFWLDNPAGSGYSHEGGGPTGCTLLHFRTRPDVEFVKTTDKYVRWTRTRSATGNALGAQPATEADRLALIAERADLRAKLTRRSGS